jgi:hypothetical protein
MSTVPRAREGISPGDFLRAVLPAPQGEERIKVLALRPDGPPQEQFARTVGEALAFASRHKTVADVYFGVTLKQGPRGDAAHTSRFQALWADVDAKGFGGSKPAALAALDRLPLLPSVVVDSGHGFHAYWLLHEPLTAADGPRARGVMRGLYRTLSEQATAPLDDVSDMARILRLPGTFNRKSTPPKPVMVVRWRPERRYSLADFAALGIGTDPRDQTLGGGADTPQWPQRENGHIPEHHRNTTLTRIGGLLRAKGLSPAAIEAALLGINATACTPPLPEAEVRRIARGMARYLPEPRLVLPSSAPVPVLAATRNGRHADMMAPLPTSLPTIRGPVGSEVATGGGGALLEASGEELAAAGAAGSAGASLPSLPLLGREGYIIQGWSHLVAGYPRAGKTELLAAQVVDWCRAGRSVLYLTEEPRSIWTVRLARLAAAAGLAEGDRAALTRLTVVFALGSDPEVLLTRALRGHEAVVVLDTLRNLLPLRDETDNSEIARALNPWIAAARAAGKTLIVAHHLRKGGGEHGEGIAGGHALLGTFDMALELVRDPQHPDRRLLRAYARLITPPELVYERDEHGGFRALGEPEALRRAEVMARVRAALTAEWQATGDIHEALDEPRPSKELLRGVLLELARNGEAERDPGIEVERVQGKMVRWRLRGAGPPDGGAPPTSLPTHPLKVGSEVGAGGRAGATPAPAAVVATTPPRGAPTPGAAPVPPAPRDGPEVLALAQQAGYPRYLAGGVRVVHGPEGWAAFCRVATPEALQAAAAWLRGRLGRQGPQGEGGDG